MTCGRLPAGKIAAMLAARIHALAAELLPQGRRIGHEWCSGDNRAQDNFKVHLTGAKAGVWSHFSAGIGGDALDLVAYVLFGGDKAQAIRWARAWLGLEGADRAELSRARQQAQAHTERRMRDGDEEAAELRALAQRLWLGSQERIAGTPVDAYLRGRGILLADLGRQPRALRFHAGLFHKPSGRDWPAMVAMATDGEGRNAALHRTFLEVLPDGHVHKAPIEPNKMVLGSYAGACIRLWRGASRKPLRDAPAGETIDITEGIEDGLSVALALPENRVVAAISLGNLGNLTFPPAVTTLRLWRQNDVSPEPIAAFKRAIGAHQARGLKVLVAEVPAPFKDANELLAADLVPEPTA